MRWQAIGIRSLTVLALLALLSGPVDRGFAQNNDNNNNNNNNNNTGHAGIVVDAQGVLHRGRTIDLSGNLYRQRAKAALSALPSEIAEPSQLRKVSLNRLEAAIEANGGAVTEDMKYLAGLIRLKYVFFYPESGDIVLAGPAEGWMPGPEGGMIGIRSGRPMLQLQDLVVALRAFPPEGSGERTIGCSIDPTQEGLAKMQSFLKRVGTQLQSRRQVPYLVNGLRKSLGLQEISIDGIPANTHFAQVMVAADYRMKLIGIGLERPPVQLTSFIEKVRPSQVASNALFRWYFVPDYECVRMTEDGLGMELVGDGVKLVGADEMVQASGARAQSGSGSNRASKAFVTSFTEKYSDLARVAPVYAELRNLIDMLVAAAHIQKEDYYADAGWDMDFLGDESKFAVETYQAPVKVGSTVTAVYKGSRLMTPIGGGVTIQPDRALDSLNLKYDEEGEIAEVRQQIKLELEDGQWWWD